MVMDSIVTVLNWEYMQTGKAIREIFTTIYKRYRLNNVTLY